MPEIHHRGDIGVPAELAWTYISHLARCPEWLFGVTEMVATGEQTRGVGAQFAGTFQVKPITLHATADVVGWTEREAITMRSVKGFPMEITLRVVPLSATETRLIAAVEYDLPGGVAGKALGRALGPIFSTAVRRADASLRMRLLELHAAGEHG
jgi:uncharacterized membrane protein